MMSGSLRSAYDAVLLVRMEQTAKGNDSENRTMAQLVFLQFRDTWKALSDFSCKQSRWQVLIMLFFKKLFFIVHKWHATKRQFNCWCADVHYIIANLINKLLSFHSGVSLRRTGCAKVHSVTSYQLQTCWCYEPYLPNNVSVEQSHSDRK